MKYSTVLFDLDGTLTDPVQGICGSVRYALQKAGRPVGPIESYHKYIGLPYSARLRFMRTQHRRRRRSFSAITASDFRPSVFLKTRYIRAFRSCCAI